QWKKIPVSAFPSQQRPVLVLLPLPDSKAASRRAGSALVPGDLVRLGAGCVAGAVVEVGSHFAHLLVQVPGLVAAMLVKVARLLADLAPDRVGGFAKQFVLLPRARQHAGKDGAQRE